MSHRTLAPRQPWIALSLSLLCTGLGHVYAGRVALGVGFFLGSLLFAPVAVAAASAPACTATLVVLVAAAAGVLGIYVFAAVHAVAAARATVPDRLPGDLNRPGVYLMFILVGLTYPLVTGWLLRAGVFEAFKTPYASMEPAILPGDRILVNKLAWDGAPRRGDVIVFRAPGERRRIYIKRVIALGGDRVSVKDRQVRVNGRPLAQERTPLPHAIREAVGGKADAAYEENGGRRYRILSGDGPQPDYPENVVPDGHCFVLGDHRDRSRDSRHFSFVLLADVLGPAQYVFWPAATWSRFGALEE